VIEFSGRGILLDIEGTTSSISFVYDVMFPFVRRELNAYLEQNWGSDSLAAACDQIAVDAGHKSLTAWAGEVATAEQCRQLIEQEVIRLMDGDVKATGLKKLQGLIWKTGFESGEMQAHLYDDVAPAIKQWNEAGVDVRIYSSGSVQAQLLFFGHTIHGDLLPQFQGHYDTSTGPKREAASYTTIAKAFGQSPEKLLFLSDVPAELDAAAEAGLQVGLVERPGNAEVGTECTWPRLKEFGEIRLLYQPEA
jgi:enolase-phosphatase E1